MGNLTFGNLRLARGFNDKASGGVTGIVVNDVEYEGSDKSSERNNDKADNGVKDGGFGFLEFAGIATRRHETYAANDNENDGDDAGNTDEPINEATNHRVNIINVDTSLFYAIIVDEVCAEGDTDGVNNGGSEHDDGETDKGTSEGLLAGSGFDWITRGEHIEVATVDYVAYDEIDGDDGDVGEDVENDLPDGAGEVIGVANIVKVDVAIPGWHAE